MTALKSNETTALLNSISDEIGMEFGMSIAERAHICAQRTWETGDIDAILHMLEEGWNRRISRDFSGMKSQVRESIARSATGEHQGDGPQIVQLAFPVIAPGFPPVPLASATHELLRWAHKAELQQLKGRQKNIDLLEHYVRVTQPFPNVSVGELVKDGRLSLEDLVPIDSTQAA